MRGAPPKRNTDTPTVAAVRKALRAKSVAEVGVRERGGRIDLTGIAPEALATLGAALGRVRLPATA